MFDFFEKTIEKLGFKLISNFTEKLIDFIKDVKENSNNEDNDNDRYRAQIGSSGDYAQIGSSGNCAQIGSSGYYAQIGSSGDYARIGSSGDYARIGSSGDCAQIGSSGDYARIGSSGDCAQIYINGDSSVGFACGYKSVIKAKNGTWISLVEYKKDKNNNYIPIFAKVAQIGNEEYKDFSGEVLNENTYYILWQKEFYPVIEEDGLLSIKLLEKKRDNIKIIKAIDIDYIYDEEAEKIKPIYIAKSKELSAHGYTLREAIEDLTYKKLDNIDTSKIIKEIKKTGKVTRSQYRAITGACSYGTNKFCEEHNIQDLEEISLEALRKILINDYGAEKFWRLIDGK